MKRIRADDLTRKIVKSVIIRVMKRNDSEASGTTRNTMF